MGREGQLAGTQIMRGNILEGNR